MFAASWLKAASNELLQLGAQRNEVALGVVVVVACSHSRVLPPIAAIQPALIPLPLRSADATGILL